MLPLDLFERPTTTTLFNISLSWRSSQYSFMYGFAFAYIFCIVFVSYVNGMHKHIMCIVPHIPSTHASELKAYNCRRECMNIIFAYIHRYNIKYPAPLYNWKRNAIQSHIMNNVNSLRWNIHAIWMGCCGRLNECAANRMRLHNFSSIQYMQSIFALLTLCKISI